MNFCQSFKVSRSWVSEKSRVSYLKWKSKKGFIFISTEFWTALDSFLNLYNAREDKFIYIFIYKTVTKNDWRQYKRY